MVAWIDLARLSAVLGVENENWSWVAALECRRERPKPFFLSLYSTVCHILGTRGHETAWRAMCGILWMNPACNTTINNTGSLLLKSFRSRLSPAVCQFPDMLKTAWANLAIQRSYHIISNVWRSGFLVVQEVSQESHRLLLVKILRMTMAIESERIAAIQIMPRAEKKHLWNWELRELNGVRRDRASCIIAAFRILAPPQSHSRWRRDAEQIQRAGGSRLHFEKPAAGSWHSFIQGRSTIGSIFTNLCLPASLPACHDHREELLQGLGKGGAGNVVPDLCYLTTNNACNEW